MKVKILNRSSNELPAYSSAFSADFDLRAKLADTDYRERLA